MFVRLYAIAQLHREIQISEKETHIIKKRDVQNGSWSTLYLISTESFNTYM